MKGSIEKQSEIKKHLFNKLKEENALWSYNQEGLSHDKLTHDQLIALTLRHLDLPEIKLLFSIFSKREIHRVWKEQLVPEGDYLYTLNRFFAWYYFKAKKPDQYLKTLQTRHLNKILAQ